MFNSLIGPYVKKLAKKYLIIPDDQPLDFINIFSEPEITLTNVRIQQEFMDMIEMPFELIDATCENIHVKIPLSSVLTRPLFSYEKETRDLEPLSVTLRNLKVKARIRWPDDWNVEKDGLKMAQLREKILLKWKKFNSSLLGSMTVLPGDEVMGEDGFPVQESHAKLDSSARLGIFAMAALNVQLEGLDVQLVDAFMPSGPIAVDFRTPFLSFRGNHTDPRIPDDWLPHTVSLRASARNLYIMHADLRIRRLPECERCHCLDVASRSVVEEKVCRASALRIMTPFNIEMLMMKFDPSGMSACATASHDSTWKENLIWLTSAADKARDQELDLFGRLAKFDALVHERDLLISKLNSDNNIPVSSIWNDAPAGWFWDSLNPNDEDCEVDIAVGNTREAKNIKNKNWGDKALRVTASFDAFRSIYDVYTLLAMWWNYLADVRRAPGLVRKETRAQYMELWRQLCSAGGRMSPSVNKALMEMEKEFDHRFLLVCRAATEAAMRAESKGCADPIRRAEENGQRSKLTQFFLGESTSEPNFDFAEKLFRPDHVVPGENESRKYDVEYAETFMKTVVETRQNSEQQSDDKNLKNETNNIGLHHALPAPGTRGTVQQYNMCKDGSYFDPGRQIKACWTGDLEPAVLPSRFRRVLRVLPVNPKYDNDGKPYANEEEVAKRKLHAPPPRKLGFFNLCVPKIASALYDSTKRAFTEGAAPPPLSFIPLNTPYESETLPQGSILRYVNNKIEQNNEKKQISVNETDYRGFDKNPYGDQNAPHNRLYGLGNNDDLVSAKTLYEESGDVRVGGWFAVDSRVRFYIPNGILLQLTAEDPMTLSYAIQGIDLDLIPPMPYPTEQADLQPPSASPISVPEPAFVTEKSPMGGSGSEKDSWKAAIAAVLSGVLPSSAARLNENGFPYIPPANNLDPPVNTRMVVAAIEDFFYESEARRERKRSVFGMNNVVMEKIIGEVLEDIPSTVPKSVLEKNSKVIHALNAYALASGNNASNNSMPLHYLQVNPLADFEPPVMSPFAHLSLAGSFDKSAPSCDNLSVIASRHIPLRREVLLHTLPMRVPYEGCSDAEKWWGFNEVSKHWNTDKDQDGGMVIHMNDQVNDVRSFGIHAKHVYTDLRKTCSVIFSVMPRARLTAAYARSRACYFRKLAKDHYRRVITASNSLVFNPFLNGTQNHLSFSQWALKTMAEKRFKNVEADLDVEDSITSPIVTDSVVNSEEVSGKSSKKKKIIRRTIR